MRKYHYYGTKKINVSKNLHLQDLRDTIQRSSRGELRDRSSFTYRQVPQYREQACYRAADLVQPT